MAVDKRLPPIRPPAKVPVLWRKRPDLAPPRRTANANFLSVNVLAGVATRFPFHPACGARTKKGTKCKAPKVAGGSRCRYHGGGSILLQPGKANSCSYPVTIGRGKMPVVHREVGSQSITTTPEGRRGGVRKTRGRRGASEPDYYAG